MKILELRFKNLNSLYGEWIIDFTGPEYRSEGLFVLTGPTGSGKSTVLDAVCLALYGATPRLGKITQGGNEIMSRRTGECYAEVLFESQVGRFRCHWEQRKARKRADGALQDQEHQIIDEDTGKPIETKKSLVVGVVEQKTGMDFDRFTRSILLAQGGFDTFLKADSEQKSKILEQITGTGIYSEISRRVHLRRRDEQTKLELLRAEIFGITLLEPEQEREIQQEIEIKENQETELTEKSTQTAKAIAWLNSIEELKKQITMLEKEAATLQGDYEAFKPEREILEHAIKAASLDGIYAALMALRKQQAKDLASLKTEEMKLPELESLVGIQAEFLKAVEQQTIQARQELNTALPLIQKIRSLDQKLAELEKGIVEANQACGKTSAAIAADQSRRLSQLKKHGEALKNVELADHYLKGHACDEWLISGLAGIEEQVESLISGQREIKQLETMIKNAVAVLNQAVKKLTDCEDHTGVCRQQYTVDSQKLQQGRDVLIQWLNGRLLREYRADKDALLREMVYLERIEELEEHRTRLEDGKPCPLCGSEIHPFARGNVPSPDRTDQQIKTLERFITQAERLETDIQKLEKTEMDTRNNLIESEKRETAAGNDRKNAENTLSELNQTMEKLQAGWVVLKQAVSVKLQPLGIEKISEENPRSLLESLKTRLKTWQAQVKLKTELENRISEIGSEIKRLDAVIETHHSVLAEKRNRLETLEKDYAAGLGERKSLYGAMIPDDEEHRLNTAVSGAETAEKNAGTRYAELSKTLASVHSVVESLKKRIQERGPDLEAGETEFVSALDAAGFQDESQFYDARLTAEQRDALSARARMLDDRRTDLNARLDDRRTRLADETANPLTDRSPEELEPQFKEYEESLRALRDTIVGLKLKLSENGAAKDRIKEKQTAIEAQKKECRRWEKLHSLIGSEDGKRYRTFVQGLTFELMVSHANAQLVKMSDRYLLIRNEKQPLELDVVDNYQAGEIRSTRNLSGGESFMVSLALALGLSKMASRNVRVDSLFLDEGFGTLDEEALETALDTLSGLQQDGKLIGIISHIPALKERIRTQISVMPGSGGQSALGGPGCRQTKT